MSSSENEHVESNSLERLCERKKPISSIYDIVTSCVRIAISDGRNRGSSLSLPLYASCPRQHSALTPRKRWPRREPVEESIPRGIHGCRSRKVVEQFAHPSFILRLFLSLTLAVGCAFAIAWHPRRASLRDPLRDFEERKALILLGVVGAVVAELSGTSQTLAFVIFGIGALLRFRTLLDNPKLTGKAIMVVVVGLACGMGSWAMAVFVTGFSWLLMFWLDSHSSCRVRIRLDETEDPKPVFDAVQSLLISHKCKLQSSSLYEDKGRMVFLLYLPTGVDPTRLEHEVRSKLRKNQVSKIAVDVV